MHEQFANRLPAMVERTNISGLHEIGEWRYFISEGGRRNCLSGKYLFPRPYDFWRACKMQKDISQFISVCADFIRGIELTSKNDAYKYSVIVPPANYSPWLTDDLFMASYASLRENTLVDVYRCYELWSLVEQSARLEGDILEVGVWRGGTGCLMAVKAKLLNLKSRVFLADTFSGVVKAGKMDTSYTGGEHSDTSVEVVLKAKENLKLDNVDILVGIFPEKTGEYTKDSLFSLCHIDVDVYESARDVLDWVWPKLLVGGTVVFDDYGCISTSGVTRLVNERKNTPNAVVIHNLNGHAIMVKTA
ncbi:TylF/MycF/NovP-related O-methyltransferase [Telmatospirillum sp.]|uniref:TylF/MycF/NovP-related O-methyltransferase n=1 Tax=Telmatospirillum sp. TaxID=2079197 RepID=UPI00283E2E27|nr:TylF/MycF/NovP-related O-methyltransferase [Telmatospirillum sp.]MDR3437142.1 TylF/MycF/NovP-related O-methyltransferase [Telmatospirillum sp.]